MNNSFIIGQYIHRESIFHLLDPRTKLISVFLFLLGLLFLDSYFSYLLAGVLVFICIYHSNIPYSFFVKGLKPIALILSFTLMYHLFLTRGGELLFQYRFLTIYQTGILTGVQLVVKIMLMVLITSLLTLTTKPLDLAYGLETLLSPLKRINFPLEQFALMISITLRFIPTIYTEANRILEAQRARGISFAEQNIWKKLWSYTSIIIPLLLTSIKHADQLSLAIDARAFGDGKQRTKFKKLEYKNPDYLMMILSLCVLLCFVWLKFS